MLLRKAYKYKLEPTKAQLATLEWTLDRCRELYNAALEERITAYRKCGVSISYYDQQANLPIVKKVRPEYSAIHSQILQETLKRLDKAYQAFFSRVKKGGVKAGFPRFQARHRYNSFTFPQGGFKVTTDGKHLRMSKIGNVKIRLSRLLEGKVKTLTVKRDSVGNWFATFAAEFEMPDVPLAKPKPEKVIGIDLGLKDFAILSTGEKIASAKLFRKAEKRLAKAQRELSRKKKGSKNREKARLKVAKLHAKVKNQRNDFQHKLSTQLVKDHEGICIEDLSLADQVQPSELPKRVKAEIAKSQNDAALAGFRQKLEYKSAWHRKHFVAVDRFFSSSKICNTCKAVNEELKITKRTWACANCGTKHDRDINAAKNIREEGLKELVRL